MLLFEMDFQTLTAVVTDERTIDHTVFTSRNVNRTKEIAMKIQSINYLWVHVNHKKSSAWMVRCCCCCCFCYIIWFVLMQILTNSVDFHSILFQFLIWSNDIQMSIFMWHNKTAETISMILIWSIFFFAKTSQDWLNFMGPSVGVTVDRVAWCAAHCKLLLSPDHLKCITSFVFYIQSGVYYNLDRHHTEMFSLRRYDRIYQTKMSTEIYKQKSPSEYILAPQCQCQCQCDQLRPTRWSVYSVGTFCSMNQQMNQSIAVIESSWCQHLPHANVWFDFGEEINRCNRLH